MNDAGTLTLEVRVQPRASREGIDAAEAGPVRVRVNAAPVDNAANRRVMELVADAFGVAKSRVEVVAGHRSRNKRLQIHGATRRPDWFPAD